MFVSTHQYDADTNPTEPFYPGTGGVVEPSDPAYDYIINLPLKPGSGSTEFRQAVMSVMARMQNFKPDLVLVSAGFDSHKDDDIGDLELIDEDYWFIANELRKIQPRVVSVLEGGYLGSDSEPGSLVRASLAHLKGLMQSEQ
ncbi:hypothetical protein HK104_008868 [Borealophlyctis nickersoniae]|nr:hypothetical protein HK104_008868 [Borealophlyctis nickersoniae]